MVELLQFLDCPITDKSDDKMPSAFDYSLTHTGNHDWHMDYIKPKEYVLLMCHGKPTTQVSTKRVGTDEVVHSYIEIEPWTVYLIDSRVMHRAPQKRTISRKLSRFCLTLNSNCQLALDPLRRK